MLSTNLKADSGLSTAYRAWAQHPELSPDAGISIYLTYTGDLAAIEALGFETHSPASAGDQALGVVRFKDIPKLSAHPNVVWMAAGQRRQKDLDTAVRDIKARAKAPITGTAVDGVWHAEIATGALTSIPKATGKGVIVAIMDSGIDYTHPMFLSQLTPTKKSRILKIWDQGLEPTAITDCPDVSLLESAKTYGREFDRKKIEDDLNGVATIPHRDCEGHGTHVAGIAAGGTLFSKHGNASKVGVAPEADIIVVKWLDTPETIHYRKPDGSADTDAVGWTARFHDAVLWCLRTATRLQPPQPVVINMSFGDKSYAGDGLDDDARFIDGLMDPTASANSTHFPKGAIVVKTAGNEGVGNEPHPDDASTPEDERRVARITIPQIVGNPDAQEVVVPLDLVDEGFRLDNTWQECDQRLHKPPLGVHCWYRRAEAPLSVRFSVKLPFGTAFGAEVMVGGMLELGVNPVVGPPPNDIAVPFTDGDHRYTIDHQDTPAVPHPDGGQVRRQYVHFFVGPKVRNGTVTYHTGQYLLRIRAPQGTVIYLVCDKQFWNGHRVIFQVARVRLPDVPLDPNIEILEEFTSLDPLGRHAITVSAYNDAEGVKKPANRYQFIARFSSRGPLRDFSDPASPKAVIPKPDIAAPGVSINSALSKDVQPGFGVYTTYFDEGVRFRENDGTSMAAPMIAGIVALLLEKNPNLNTTQVRQALASAPQPAVSPSATPDATRAYGAGIANAMSSHANA